jgi:hypothetical protein
MAQDTRGICLRTNEYIEMKICATNFNKSVMYGITKGDI